MSSDLSHERSACCFKGWIPNASGYLSFTVIGQTSHPTKAVVANVGDDTHRFLVCWQKRPILDTPFPWLLSQFPRWRDGGLEWVSRDRYLWFLVVAACEKKRQLDGSGKFDERALKGDIYIIRSGNWKRAYWQIRRIQRNLLKLDNYPAGVLQDRFSKNYEWIHKYLENDCVFDVIQPNEENNAHSKSEEKEREGKLLLKGAAVARAKFVLCRDGEFSLSLTQSHYIEDSEKDRKNREKIASQIYYFIRDIVHRHQHHSPHSDQLTVLYPLDESDPGKWARRSHYHLMRRVISLKRSTTNDHLESAIGVLAYARSLAAVVKRFSSEKSANDQAGGKESKSHEPEYNVENLEKSIRAKIESNRSVTQNLIASRTRMLSLVAVIVSIMSLNVGIIKLADTPNLPLHDIYKKWHPCWLVTHFT